MDQHRLPFPPSRTLAVISAALAEVGVEHAVSDYGTELANCIEPDGATHPEVAFKAWNLAYRSEGLPDNSFGQFVEQLLLDPAIAQRNRYWLRYHGIDV